MVRRFRQRSVCYYSGTDRLAFSPTRLQRSKRQRLQLLELCCHDLLSDYLVLPTGYIPFVSLAFSLSFLRAPSHTCLSRLAKSRAS